MNWWYLQRGGTLVMTDNVIPDLSCVDLGTKRSLNMQVQSLRRNAGLYGCWGMNISGVQYPAPNQVGWGHNGTTAVSDPVYIWGNSRVLDISLPDYVGDNQCVGTVDSIADYVIDGRDYFNGSTAKPGWSKFTYPHPLRTGEGEPAPLPGSVAFGAGAGSAAFGSGAGSVSFQ
jgi:hypothetical protein